MKRPISLIAWMIATLSLLTGAAYSSTNPPPQQTTQQQYSLTNTANAGNNSAPLPTNSGLNAQDHSVANTARVILTSADIREQPRVGSPVVVEVLEGDGLTLVGSRPNRGWYHVRPDGSTQQGWIHGSAIELTIGQPHNQTRTDNTNRTSSVTARPQPTALQRIEEAAVYVTRTDDKYHRGGCRYLSRSQIPISLLDARSGYAPCSVCRPPR